MATFSSSQSEFSEQKLESNLIKSASCLPSSLSNKKGSTLDEKDSVARPDNRGTGDLIAEPSALSGGSSNAALNDAKLKVIWDKIMKDFGLTRKPHRDTAVLMISWAKKFDDLHTEAEVDQLESVFTKLFHYKVEKQQLSNSEDKSYIPSLQISQCLINFVRTFDSDSTLLIVYYAGHGIPGKPGELYLAGYGPW
jgi:hypothetical protein